MWSVWERMRSRRGEQTRCWVECVDATPEGQMEERGHQGETMVPGSHEIERRGDRRSTPAEREQSRAESREERERPRHARNEAEHCIMTEASLRFDRAALYHSQKRRYGEKAEWIQPGARVVLVCCVCGAYVLKKNKVRSTKPTRRRRKTHRRIRSVTCEPSAYIHARAAAGHGSVQ